MLGVTSRISPPSFKPLVPSTVFFVTSLAISTLGILALVGALHPGSGLGSLAHTFERLGTGVLLGSGGAFLLMSSAQLVRNCRAHYRNGTVVVRTEVIPQPTGPAVQPTPPTGGPTGDTQPTRSNDGGHPNVNYTKGDE